MEQQHAEWRTRLGAVADELRNVAPGREFEGAREDIAMVLAEAEGALVLGFEHQEALASVLSDRVEAVAECAQAVVPRNDDEAADRDALLRNLAAYTEIIDVRMAVARENADRIPQLVATVTDLVAQHRSSVLAAATPDELAAAFVAYNEDLQAAKAHLEGELPQMPAAGAEDHLLAEIRRLADSLALEERIDEQTIGELVLNAVGGEAALERVADERGLF